MPTFHTAIPIVSARLCTLAVLLAATPAGAVEVEDFDLQRSLPALGVLGPIAIVVLRFIASLVGVVPTSPLLLAAGATEGLFLGSVYVLAGAQLGAVVGFLIGSVSAAISWRAEAGYSGLHGPASAVGSSTRTHRRRN
jgi:uncharacterized membrane protein YdjX (TVP38/TMEM64 family)